KIPLGAGTFFSGSKTQESEQQPAASAPSRFIKDLSKLIKDPAGYVEDRYGFNQPETKEAVVKKGIVFDSSKILPVLPYFSFGSEVKIRAIDVKVDLFKGSESEVKFGCRIKEKTPTGIVELDGKVEILGKGGDSIKFSGANEDSVSLNLECSFDSATTGKLTRGDPSEDYVTKQVVLTGMYMDFTTRSCIDVYNVKKGERMTGPDIKNEGWCDEGCGLTILDVKTQPQPWVFPDPTKSGSGYTPPNAYSLTAAMRRDSSYNGDLSKVKLIRLDYEHDVFELKKDDASFVVSDELTEQSPFVKNINDKLEMRRKGKDVSLDARDRTLNYVFMLRETSNERGKLQASRMCMDGKYDYEVTEDASVKFNNKV
ncbi:MAG: hypothetical protein AABW87_02440, partial [Nanoarchaeota archaeon]